MIFGLTDHEYRYIEMQVLVPVEARGGQVFCYGSRARGDYRQFSDLDLMIEAGNDLSALLGEIQEQLIQSNFPYKVDLVEFRTFADAYKPGYMRDKRPFRQFPAMQKQVTPAGTA